MPLFAILLAAQLTPAALPLAPACRAAQLRLSVDNRNGDFNGMSHSGTELSIRNLGPDCMMPALPTVQLRDGRGRMLNATRQIPLGLHPAPVMLPVRIAGGHRAAIDLRWVSNPVYTSNDSIHAGSVTVEIEGTVLRAPLTATLYGQKGKPITFDQMPLRAMEGMATGRQYLAEPFGPLTIARSITARAREQCLGTVAASPRRSGRGQGLLAG
jgi:hypothetical protein